MDFEKKVLYLALYFILTGTVYSSSLQQIKVTGKIVDSITKKPLVNSNIIIVNQNSGTTSDEEGNYQLLLSPGKYIIKFDVMGYQSQQKIVSIFPHLKPMILNINLEPIPIKGQEISITAFADEPKITRYELPPAKMRTIANPLPDALLSLKTLPGVFSGNDQSTFY
ncbi:MAG: hypothetical protein GF353_02750, partial [Candidatus Lokiarchaeota archaeon]|nr:hypothetical protein [Candidatus Lokiarchaeota archaeon]